MQVTELPLASITPNPAQPRKTFDEASLAELAASIKANGLLQPISVVQRGDGFLIVAGERRYRACKLAGLESIRAIVVEADDATVAQLALIENLQREDMDPMEIAYGYKAVLDAGTTAEELSEQLGKPASEICFYLPLTNLAPEIQDAVKRGIIKMRVGWNLARVPDLNEQRVLFSKIVHGEVSPNLNAAIGLVDAWLAAKNQPPMFGEPDTPAKVECRQRAAKTAATRLEAVGAAIARLAEALDDTDAAATMRPAQVQTIDLLGRELSKLAKRVDTENRSRELVAQLQMAGEVPA